MSSPSQYKNHPLTIAVALIAASVLITKGCLFVVPERQVGWVAWAARALTIVAFALLCACIVLVFVHPKSRRHFLKNSPKNKFIRFALIAVTALFGLVFFLLSLSHVATSALDFSHGPYKSSIVQVDAHGETDRVRMRYSTYQVPVVIAHVMTADGKRVELTFRSDEWDHYRTSLHKGAPFTYYRHSRIWMPSSD